MVQPDASAGLQTHRPGGVQRLPRGPVGYCPSGRMGLWSGKAVDEKSEALLSAPLGISAICPASYATEPRGAREALCRRTLPRGSRRHKSAANTVRGRRRRLGIGLNACAGNEVALGKSRLRGSQASLNSNCQKNRRKQFSSPTTRHIACNVVVNALQQYEWLASLATAKFERRCPILELAHPPSCDNGANSLGIHEARLLKSSALRQEKPSACNRNCAATDEHFCHDLVFDRRADVNVAGT
jgi:hypothetical protein